jgi:hypothetical protein
VRQPAMRCETRRFIRLKASPRRETFTGASLARPRRAAATGGSNRGRGPPIEKEKAAASYIGVSGRGRKTAATATM